MATVEVRFHREGKIRAKAATLAQVDGDLLAKLGVAEPFGRFAAILPGCVPPRAIRVIARGANGEFLGAQRGESFLPHFCHLPPPPEAERHLSPRRAMVRRGHGRQLARWKRCVRPIGSERRLLTARSLDGPHATTYPYQCRILVSVTENHRPKFWALQMLFALILMAMGILSLAGVIAVPVPFFLASFLLLYVIDNRDRISAKLHRLR